MAIVHFKLAWLSVHEKSLPLYHRQTLIAFEGNILWGFFLNVTVYLNSRQKYILFIYCFYGLSDIIRYGENLDLIPEEDLNQKRKLSKSMQIGAVSDIHMAK